MFSSAHFTGTSRRENWPHREETTEFKLEVTLARLLETDEAALAAAPNEVCVEALARADEAADEADAATDAAED